EIARRRIGACLDTCHHAVVFEEVGEVLARYAERGVRVVKAQLSSAVELGSPGSNPAGVERLRAFCEPRYLHQTYLGPPRGSIVHHFEDLPGIFEGGRLVEPAARSGLIRSHFHVPLAWEGDDELGTTRSLLEKALPLIAKATNDLEVETYTWSV